MSESEAIEILRKNLQAHEIGSGYTDDCMGALIEAHKRWFNRSFPTHCKPCVISAAKRCFNFLITNPRFNDTSTT